MNDVSSLPARQEARPSGPKLSDPESSASELSEPEPSKSESSETESARAESDLVESEAVKPEPLDVEPTEPPKPKMTDLKSTEPEPSDVEPIESDLVDAVSLETEPSNVELIDDSEPTEAELPTVVLSKSKILEAKQLESKPSVAEMPTVVMPRPEPTELELNEEKPSVAELPTVVIPRPKLPESESTEAKPLSPELFRLNLPGSKAVLAKPELPKLVLSKLVSPKPELSDVARSVNLAAKAKIAASTRQSARPIFVFVGIAMILIFGFSSVIGSLIISYVNNISNNAQKIHEFSLVVSSYYQSIEQQKYDQAFEYVDANDFLFQGKAMTQRQFTSFAQKVDQQQSPVVNAVVGSSVITNADGSLTFTVTVTRQNKSYPVQVVVKAINQNDWLIISASSV